jgi:hypothetical protein
VEDYAVEIQELPEDTGTIVLQKTTDPPGATDFSFLDDFGIPFSLDDGLTLTIPFVPVGTYGITETVPIGWEIAGLGCVSDDPNDTSTWGGNAVTIDLDANETITCTFNNAQLGTIVLRKETHPPLDISFDFLNDFGIGIPDLDIDGNMTLTIPFVPAGRYSITEADPVPVGFQLIDVYCQDPDGGSFADLDTRTATIELDPGETVTCTFINGQYILTVDTDGEGTGTVTSEPDGIFCGDDCTEYYAPDSDVTLTAHPGVNSYFVGWSDDCSGTDPTTQVTMDADKLCTATFGTPIGGVAAPVNRLELLLPWLGLAGLVSLAALMAALIRRRKTTAR